MGSESVDWVKGSWQIPDAHSCEHNKDSSGSINNRIFWWLTQELSALQKGFLSMRLVSILTFQNSHNLCSAGALSVCAGEWLISGGYEKSSSTRMRSRCVYTKCMTFCKSDIWSTSLPCYVGEVLSRDYTICCCWTGHGTGSICHQGSILNGRLT
jgi:hypothetical protein